MDEWNRIQRKLDKPFDCEIMEREEREEWAPIPEYEHYEVSTLGRVRNEEGKLLRVYVKNMTPSVALFKNKKRRLLSVGKLVAAAFLPNPFDAKTVRHKDGDNHNNRVENLEWRVNSKRQAIIRYDHDVFSVTVTRDDNDHEETFTTENGAKTYICDVLCNPYAGDYVFDNLGRAIVFAPNMNPENKTVTILASKIEARKG